uniref:7TM_GPCR_Srx domain-containing protein n=1 Tax=Caenorhabditis tropicalis TaxID=1561998 RepID=A0A1I7UJA2_9PELO
MESVHSDNAKFFAIFELSNCVPVYAIVVIFTMSRVIRKVQKEKLMKLNASVQVGNDEYFDRLKEQWCQGK